MVRRLRPLAWLIIIVNIFFLWQLFKQFQSDDDDYYRAGALVAYMLKAGFATIVLYVFFRITEKRK
jgi:hypothetical protein